ncbi:hypothetical protein [uncultured Mucilaginibacter sp.]|uniref:hypothetical protein n=1 Tax=uncultured Mucilaginibacter sp. TaxID=797541 RepID=UPI0025EC61D2|nr:hypothetical protein [uncultured Mucilaginibacter sp.]
MPDKKLSELELTQQITGDDTSILVKGDTDYQYAFSSLLSYIASNIQTGNTITFVNALPQNNVGKNQDVSLNIADGTFYQKRNGTWVTAYTFTANQPSGGQVLFGDSTPLNNTGSINDTYINTSTGEFYDKQADGWRKAFSMLNGPPGGPGPRGEQGIPGINGKSILHGTINPMNQSVGSDGDFYINSFSWTIFGPKTNGDWGIGKSMTQEIEGLGNLSSLNTSQKNDLVSAINEIFSQRGLQSSDIGSGLTIVNNKLTLDLESKSLVSPSISAQWKLWKNDGLTSYSTPTSNSKALVVDKGVKADLVATYSYPVPNASQAKPLSAESSTFGNELPLAGETSRALAVSSISTNRTDMIVLRKPKSGLIVSGSQVILARGDDSTSDNCTISFKGRGVLFYSTKETLTAADIESEYNKGTFQDGRSRTFNSVNSGPGEYVYYVYDSAFGQFTSVVYNDAEAYFTAFRFLSQVTIVNNAGINQNVIVARSNATNAFTNSKLSFL